MRLFGMLLMSVSIGLSSAVPAQQRTHTLTGTFCTHAQFHSKYLLPDRNILVYLPPDYEQNTTQRYPVLYLHDGQNLFVGDTNSASPVKWRVDQTAQELIETKQIEPLIIVGIYNTDWGQRRMAEYTPTQNEKQEGGEADTYGRLIVEELKPFIDRTYRTRKEAANTGLGGSSLGGLASLYLGLKYPKVFGKLAVLSPSVWWDYSVILGQVLDLPAKLPLRLWVDIGTDEGRDMLYGARQLKSALLAKGWKLEKNLAYLEAKGAAHNEQAWAERVAPMMKFLFPAKP